MSDQDETITVSKTDYEELVRDSTILMYLRGAGIDNTMAYEEGMREYYENEGSEEE